MTQDEWVNITLFVHFKFAHFRTSACLQCGESSSDITSRTGGSEDNYLWHVQYLPLTNFKMLFRVNKIPVIYPPLLILSQLRLKQSSTMSNVIWVFAWEGETSSLWRQSFCHSWRSRMTHRSHPVILHYCRKVVSEETSAPQNCSVAESQKFDIKWIVYNHLRMVCFCCL